MDVAGGYQFTEEKKYNEKLEIINHQSKVKYENQRNSLAAHKEYLLYCRWKAKNPEGFSQNWIIKLAEL